MIIKNDKPLKIDDVILSPNVTDKLSDDFLASVGSTVVEEYEKDKVSRLDWETLIEKAVDLSTLKCEKKDYPWPNASNVKFPLITNAVIQFSARTVPEIVRGGKVVEVAVVGKNTREKELRAKRVARHMSYQLLIESADWEESVDKLVHLIANVGIAHKKTWYDPIKRKNVSELLDHKEFVVHKDTVCLEEARRATHVMYHHTNDLVSHMRAGLYKECEMDELHSNNTSANNAMFEDDAEHFHEILEQHRYLDLDDDGYEEPYVVTVHKDSRKVLRIVGRFDIDGVSKNSDDEIVHIEPVHYFTSFHFLPSMDGSYYSLGFGPLLYSLNEAVNTNINQLIDSGTLANLQGGFIGKGLRVKGGVLKHRPGEWKMLDSALGVDIAQNIVPLNYKEPSAVLFQLLGLLVDTTKELSTISEVMNGQQTAQNVPATTILSLIEQGLKVFSSIQKRLHRSLKKEFEKLYRLNKLFLDPEVYFNMQDESGVVLQKDYEDESLDIKPVSDPTMSSDAQRLATSQALLALVGMPGINNEAVLKRYIESLDVADAEELIVPKEQGQAPDPKLVKVKMDAAHQQDLMKLQADAQGTKDQELMFKMAQGAADLDLKRQRTEAEIMEIKARAIDALARAEATEKGTQINAYKTVLESLKERVKLNTDLNSEAFNRNMPGMVNMDKELSTMTPTESVPSAEEDIDNRNLEPPVEPSV